MERLERLIKGFAAHPSKVTIRCCCRFLSIVSHSRQKLVGDLSNMCTLSPASDNVWSTHHCRCQTRYVIIIRHSSYKKIYSFTSFMSTTTSLIHVTWSRDTSTKNGDMSSVYRLAIYIARLLMRRRYFLNFFVNVLILTVASGRKFVLFCRQNENSYVNP